MQCCVKALTSLLLMKLCSQAFPVLMQPPSSFKKQQTKTNISEYLKEFSIIKYFLSEKLSLYYIYTCSIIHDEQELWM